MTLYVQGSITYRQQQVTFEGLLTGPTNYRWEHVEAWIGEWRDRTPLPPAEITDTPLGILILREARRVYNINLKAL